MMHFARVLTELRQLEEIKALSAGPHTRGVLIYKHSTSCAISRMAYGRLESGWDFSDDTLPFYYLDLLRYRDISNETARMFNVTHESPQILLISGGSCVFHASHTGVSVNAVKRYLDEH